MGLADRDYMRDRRANAEAPFRPPEQSSTWFVWIVLACVAILFLLFKGFAWYEQRLTPSSGNVSVGPARQTEEPKQVVPPPAAAASLEKTPGLGKIRRCDRNGAVEFSDVQCKGESVVVLERMPAANEFASSQAPQSGSSRNPGQIFLCRGYDDQMFWAQAHCNQHRAHIERIAYVPAGLPFEQQVKLAKQQRAEAQARAEPVTAPSLPSVNHAANLKQVCSALEEEIRTIDARARQPLSAWEQDALAARRKKARDEQFRLRCA